MDIEKGKYWDVAWNPMVGCSKVSAGCRNCWAEKMARRMQGIAQRNLDQFMHRDFDGTAKYFGTVNEKGWTGYVRLEEDEIDKPLKWRKPRIVATCWMGDMFHYNGDALDVYRVLDSMERFGRPFDDWGNRWLGSDGFVKPHTFLVLTKRPERMREIVGAWLAGYAHENKRAEIDHIWFGVSVEDQKSADERLPHLQALKGVRPNMNTWVSVEPMLGSVVLYEYLDGIGQVVCGGETGPGSRPLVPVREFGLRMQCLGMRVPYFFKSWGGGKKDRRVDGVTWDDLAWV